jgi:hypothetical protein
MCVVFEKTDTRYMNIACLDTNKRSTPNYYISYNLHHIPVNHIQANSIPRSYTVSTYHESIFTTKTLHYTRSTTPGSGPS